MPLSFRSIIRLVAATLAGLILASYAIGEAPRTFAAGEAVSVGSLSVGVGQQGTVSLAALNIGSPGLGVWTIDVMYNPSIVAVKNCTAFQFGVCVTAFNVNTVRDTGATAQGLFGNVPLADIRFTCIAPGTTALTISIDVLADATIGNPQPINAALQNGSINCLVGNETSTATATVTPTATSTATATATATSTITPTHTALDFSINVRGADCSTQAGHLTTCNIGFGVPFALEARLDSLPAGVLTYVGFDLRVTYTGVISHDNPSTAKSPGCQSTLLSITPGVSVFWGCVQPGSSYLGPLGTLDFECNASGRINLVHGVNGATDLVASDQTSHAESEGTMESLDINCLPSLGGVAQYPGGPSGANSDAVAAAIATALAAMASAAWYARRHWLR